MRQITDVKELRSIQMAILDSIVDVCDRNNINYTLAGGTLIGALRHRGYIPWDDDIDLYMLRADYERFLYIYNNVQESIGSPYRLLSPEISSKKYYYTFGKVVDNRTEMIEDWAKDFPIGVYVDIFPIDYAYDDEKARERQFRLKHLLHKIRNCKKSPTCYLRSRLAYYCYRYLPVPLRAIEWLQNRYVFLRKPTSLVTDMHSPQFGSWAAFPVSAFDSYTTAEFEGKQYKILAGYDTYLRHHYKFHYMTLPPEDQRIPHYFKAWWK